MGAIALPPGAAGQKPRRPERVIYDRFIDAEASARGLSAKEARRLVGENTYDAYVVRVNSCEESRPTLRRIAVRPLAISKDLKK